MFVCTPCMIDDRPGVEAVAIHRCSSVCLEHLVAAWRAEQLCAVCRYWAATRDDLCDQCADDLATRERRQR